MPSTMPAQTPEPAAPVVSNLVDDSPVKPAKTSLKRPRDDDADDKNDDEDKENNGGSFVDQNEIMKWDCDQVRNRCRRFMDSGEMKVTKFQQALGVTYVSYRSFMSQSGAYKGANSDTFSAAYLFFREREEREKLEKKKPGGTKSAKATPKVKATVTDFGDLKLEGEDSEDCVKIFATCDEIRDRIETHMGKPEVTQATFLKDLALQAKVKGIQSKQLNDFRNYCGAHVGNTSRVFYGAYVFFEKMRIRDGEPKSEHRLVMEKKWPQGFKTTRTPTSFWVGPGQETIMDEYGCLELRKKRK